MNARQLLLTAICAVVSALSLHVIVRSLEQTAPITHRSVVAGATVPAEARALRPNYPYSVIPGGAYSPAELRYVNQHDSVVRDHYSDFDLNAARLVVLTANRYQYASFRMNNRVFWTRHRLLIPKGEVLLTDGRNYARTRCGNRLSDTAKAETTPLQPPDTLLSLPPFRTELLKTGLIQLAPAPPAGELAQQYPVLPFESPRLAPYLPSGTEANLRLPESWPAPENFSPMAEVASAPFPALGSTSGNSLPKPYTIKPYTPPMIAAEVPEPGSLALFGVVLCASGWLLGRMARANRRVQKRSREGETSLQR